MNLDGWVGDLNFNTISFEATNLVESCIERNNPRLGGVGGASSKAAR